MRVRISYDMGQRGAIEAHQAEAAVDLSTVTTVEDLVEHRLYELGYARPTALHDVTGHSGAIYIPAEDEPVGRFHYALQ